MNNNRTPVAGPAVADVLRHHSVAPGRTRTCDQVLRSYGALSGMPDLGLYGEHGTEAAQVICSLQAALSRAATRAEGLDRSPGGSAVEDSMTQETVSRADQ